MGQCRSGGLYVHHHCPRLLGNYVKLMGKFYFRDLDCALNNLKSNEVEKIFSLYVFHIYIVPSAFLEKQGYKTNERQ